MIVVDASALTAFILKEPEWRKLAPHLLNAVSVDHVVKEVANAIWKAYAVKKLVSFNDAIRLYQLLERMIGVNIVLESERRYVSSALRIALEHGITVYDALYIALARERNLPLLTLDERQARVAYEVGVTVIEV